MPVRPTCSTKALPSRHIACIPARDAGRGTPTGIGGLLRRSLVLSALALGACSGGNDGTDLAGAASGGDRAVASSPAPAEASMTPVTSDTASNTTTTATGGSPTTKAAPTAAAAVAAVADCTAFYAARPDFALDGAKRIDPIATIARPVRGTPSEDPAYGTCLTRMTDHATDFTAADTAVTNRPTFTRNDYSRRQAWNANNTMTVVYDSTGHWHAYDAATGTRIKRLAGLAADAEPHWDPTNPDRLVYLQPSGGGATVHELTVSSNTSTTIGNLRARLATLWPGADQAFTGAEGSPSRDGRYWCFMVRANDGASPRSVGLVTWDRQTDRIIGNQSLHGEWPDHVSMSPSGNHCVMSVAAAPGQEPRVVSWSRDFSQSRTIQNRSEHSDIALAENGDDVYVSVDYSANEGSIFMVNLATGVRTDLAPTYFPGVGVASAMHFSGKAYDRPGWVLVSTYADGGGARQWLHRKIFALKLDASAQVRQLAFHRSVYNGYWSEPHATVNRDFSRVMFNSNWGSGVADDIDAYQITLPSGILARAPRAGSDTPTVPGTPGEPNPPTPPSPSNPVTGQPLSAAVTAASLVGYDARITLTTGRAADCRMAGAAGYGYGALYDDLIRTADGLTHTKAFSVGSPSTTTVWAVCRARDDAAEKEVAILLDPAASTPFTVSLLSATMNGYDAAFRLSSNEPATCRGASEAGHSWGALYEPVQRSTDGLTHQRTLVLGMPVATTVYAVCKADASGIEREVAIPLAPAASGGANAGPFAITVRTATRNGYTGRYTLDSNRPARCRTASNPGYGFDALYDNLTRSADGRTHSKQLSLASPTATTVYAVCRSDEGNRTAEISIRLP